MPDIGLLQGGPPRPRVAPPVAACTPEPDEPAPPSAPAAFAALVTMAGHSGISVAADQTTGNAPVAASSAPVAPPPIRAIDLFCLLVGLLVIIGTGLWIRDPWPADEPRFASLARDMVLKGEWLFPRVGGDLYQDKPPLFFWLLALGYWITGSVRASFLVPSFLAAGGVLFLIYDIGRRLVSRAAGLAAALTVLCTLQFVIAMRGAQIDPTLCFLTTLSLYALLRHLLLGPSWGWYFIAGFAAGLGIFTKGVGFLPMLALLPYFLLRGFKWNGLAPIDAGRLGWRWWLAPLAMFMAVSLWFVPMLVAVAHSPPEYAAYRDEILFKQTVGRYAAAWHHVKGWYYFVAEVIPPLWLPWTLLLFWLVPRFRDAFRARDARVWLPLSWVLLVLLFFSISPGKRGIYILPALPALALAALPYLETLIARPGVQRAGFILGGSFFFAAVALAIAHAMGTKFAVDALIAANLARPTAVYVFIAFCGAGLVYSYIRAPIVAFPAALGALTIVFSFFIAPAMNPERSSSAFVHGVMSRLREGELLGLVAYKEQFLLYVDRPTVNFGHRRWLEGPQELYDASAWLNTEPGGVLLVPERALTPCFPAHATSVGRSSDERWFLVRPPASRECASKGDPGRAILYFFKALHS